MGVIKVVCILLWDCLVDVIVYFFDILLMIQLAFGRVLWKVTNEEDKTRIRRQLIEQIINLENQQDEDNELALTLLRDYYHFIKEN